MFYIKIQEKETDKITIINFENKEEALLYRNYHCKFDAWDKKETWVAEEFLNPNYIKLITEEKEIEMLNSKKEAVKKKYYKIVPKFYFIEDNLGKNVLELFWDNLRLDRNQLLNKTDWTQLADNKIDTKNKQLYREYRDYLRDLPKNYNDDSISKYRIMDFEDWFKFKYIK